MSGWPASSQPAEIQNPMAYLYRLGSNLMLDRLRGERRTAHRDGAWLDSQTARVWAARRSPPSPAPRPRSPPASAWRGSSEALQRAQPADPAGVPDAQVRGPQPPGGGRGPGHLQQRRRETHDGRPQASAWRGCHDQPMRYSEEASCGRRRHLIESGRFAARGQGVDERRARHHATTAGRREEAAGWFARLQGEAATGDDWLAFETLARRRRRRTPAPTSASKASGSTWTANRPPSCGRWTPPPLAARRAPPATPLRRRRPSRRAWLGAGVGAVAARPGGGRGGRQPAGQPSPRPMRPRPARPATFTLADGTRST